MFEDFWIFFRCFVEKRSTLSDPVDHFPSPASSLTFDLDTSTTSWSFFFAASSKIQNGLESWCIWNGNLSNLHPKVVGYIENFTLWKSVDEIVTQCNFQRDLHFMCNLSLHWLILWNRLMFLIEEMIWSSWYDNDNDNVIWYGSKLRSEWYPDRQTFAPAAPLPKLWPVPILISVKLNILQLTIWSISLDL